MSVLDKPKREFSVTKASEELDGEIGRVSNVVQALEERLAPLLRQEPPEETGKAEADSSCPFADELFACCGRLHGLRDRLQNLLDRLEI